MKRILLCLTIICVGTVQLTAQTDTLFYTNVVSKPIVVANLGDTLLNPWAGGLNQPQFSMIYLNQDTLKDLVVFDRSGNTTLTFIAIRRGSGKIEYLHAPQYERNFPKSLEMLLLRDYDKDGHEDAYFVDPKDIYVKLSRNKGDNTFDPPNSYLKAYNFQTPPTPDSSNFSLFKGNIPAIDDIDLDGDLDFVSTGYCGSEMLLYLNNTIENSKALNPPSFEMPDNCFGYLKEDNFGNLVFIAKCPKYYRYNKKKHCATKTLTLFDMDNDGDNDLLFGNSENSRNSILVLVNGKKDLSMKIDSFIRVDTLYFTQAVKDLIPIAPASYLLDINQDGETDLILAGNETQRREYPIREINQVLLLENVSTTKVPDFQYRTNRFMVDGMIDAGGWSKPVFWDADNDGDMDLIIATNGDHFSTKDSMDRLVYYQNTGTKQNPVFKFSSNDLWGISKDSIRTLAPCFGDLNGDGIDEMMSGDFFGNLHLYENKGTKSNPDFRVISKNAFGISVWANSHPQIIDLNRDGLNDLVIGCQIGTVYWYKNTGTKTAAAFTLQTDSLGKIFSNEFLHDDPPTYNYIGNSTPYIADLDKDGKYDLIMGGHDGTFHLYRNIEKNINGTFAESKNFFQHQNDSFYNEDFGFGVSPAMLDVNNDSIPDLFVGTSKGGIQFLRGNIAGKKIGIEEHPLSSLVLYPNPANTWIRIDHLPIGNYSVRIFDASGKQQLFQTLKDIGQTIDIKALVAGFYTVTVEGKGYSYPMKLAVLK